MSNGDDMDRAAREWCHEVLRDGMATDWINESPGAAWRENSDRLSRANFALALSSAGQLHLKLRAKVGSSDLVSRAGA
jgi:hypothetical protein